MAKIKSEENQGQVNPALAKSLGEEMTEMLDSAGRKLYAALVEGLKNSIGGTLNEHKAAVKALIKEEFGNRGLIKANEALGPWVGQVVADAFQTVGEDIEEDLESIADSMLDEPEEAEEEPEAEVEELPKEEEEPEAKAEEEAPLPPKEEEEPEAEEEEPQAEEEEPEEEELEEEGKIAEAMADLNLLKKKGLKIAGSIAKAGDPDTAAFLRMAMKKL